MTDERVQRVLDRFAEGLTGDDCKAAIDGAAKDDWLMGRGPGAKPGGYRGIETILRDTAQVERLAALGRGEIEPDLDEPRYRPDFERGEQARSPLMDPAVAKLIRDRGLDKLSPDESRQGAREAVRVIVRRSEPTHG